MLGAACELSVDAQAAQKLGHLDLLLEDKGQQTDRIEPDAYLEMNSFAPIPMDIRILSNAQHQTPDPQGT